MGCLILNVITELKSEVLISIGVYCLADVVYIWISKYLKPFSFLLNMVRNSMLVKYQVISGECWWIIKHETHFRHWQSFLPFTPECPGWLMTRPGKLCWCTWPKSAAGGRRPPNSSTSKTSSTLWHSMYVWCSRVILKRYTDPLSRPFSRMNTTHKT